VSATSARPRIDGKRGRDMLVTVRKLRGACRRDGSGRNPAGTAAFACICIVCSTSGLRPPTATKSGAHCVRQRLGVSELCPYWVWTPARFSAHPRGLTVAQTAPQTIFRLDGVRGAGQRSRTGPFARIERAHSARRPPSTLPKSVHPLKDGCWQVAKTIARGRKNFSYVVGPPCRCLYSGAFCH
jgi:hypothetical protein